MGEEKEMKRKEKRGTEVGEEGKEGERKMGEEGSGVPGKAKGSDAGEITLGSRVESSKQMEEEQSTSVNKDDMEEDDEDEEDEEDSGGLWASPRQLCLAEYLPPGQFSFLPPARYVFSGAEVVIEESDDEEEEDESLPDEDDQQLILPGPSDRGDEERSKNGDSEEENDGREKDGENDQ